jgi:hypothetical protein
LALSVPEGSLPLLPPLRLLRQSLIDHLRDTVQNPYLLHPHTGLYIKLSKYEFFVTKTKFLGLIVGRDRFKIDPEKVRAILE